MNKTPSHYYGLILIISLPINTTMNWKPICLEFVKAIHMHASNSLVPEENIDNYITANPWNYCVSSLLNDSVF